MLCYMNLNEHILIKKLADNFPNINHVIGTHYINGDGIMIKPKVLYLVVTYIFYF
jgi:hypothetical protein